MNTSSQSKIEKGLEEFNSLRDNLRHKIIDFKTCDYIKFLESSKKGLIKLIDEFQDQCFTTLNSPSEKNLINLIDENIFKLLSTAKLKDLKKIEEENKEILFTEHIYEADFSYYFSEISNLQALLQRYDILKKTFDDLLLDNLKNTIVDVNKEITGFRQSKNIFDNLKTESIYEIAVNKYKKLENNYRFAFYLGLGSLLIISIALFFVKSILVQAYLTNIEFWIIKLSVIVVGITLISYFLKQSSHYQRLADQNYQTQIELQAYPSFMASIPSDEAASVRKELALKYFGRDIDSTPHKDMANLISEQMKNTTEMVKAATDVLKVKSDK